VLLEDEQYRAIALAAQAAQRSVAAWVHHALAQVRCRPPLGDAHQKILAVRDAVQYNDAGADSTQLLNAITRNCALALR